MIPLSIERLRTLANDKRPTRAPYIGIPLELNGKRICIAVKRNHLQAAVATTDEAEWDDKSMRLIFTRRTRWNRSDGTRPALNRYSLISQNPILGGCARRGTVYDILTQWARIRRKSIVRKSTTPDERKAAMLAKLVVLETEVGSEILKSGAHYNETL